MKRIILSLLGGLVLAGCQDFEEPVLLPPVGLALKHNMVAQIVPTPPVAWPPVTSAVPQQLAFERYQLGEIISPAPVTTTIVPGGG